MLEPTKQPPWRLSPFNFAPGPPHHGTNENTNDLIYEHISQKELL